MRPVAAFVLLLAAVAAEKPASECVIAGQPCKDANGQASRCFVVKTAERNANNETITALTCAPAPPACSPGAKYLTACSSDGDETRLCTPFNGREHPACLSPDFYGSTQSYDRCYDKPDGANCDLFYIAEDTAKGFALYSSYNSTCRDGYCQDARYVACNGQPVQATCMYNVIEFGYVVEKTGKCEESVIGWNMCSVTSQQSTKVAPKETTWPPSVELSPRKTTNAPSRVATAAPTATPKSSVARNTRSLALSASATALLVSIF
ncbi:hypothetical protein ATCC90586_010767 [Pythium insidiosum]|nr:hypothetical protein ATCC90586_010767 [Pythium insidiosum]